MSKQGKKNQRRRERENRRLARLRALDSEPAARRREEDERRRKLITATARPRTPTEREYYSLTLIERELWDEWRGPDGRVVIYRHLRTTDEYVVADNREDR